MTDLQKALAAFEGQLNAAHAHMSSLARLAKQAEENLQALYVSQQALRSMIAKAGE